jgi:cyclopropane-fatty-acyl-phospholipid synthase
VKIILDDYRKLAGQFDRIFSLGMFEHVGLRNYRRYFSVVRKLLVDDGLFLLHTIGRNNSAAANDPWIERYIFPNSMLPSMAQIASASEGLWVTEDWHGFGPDYDRTLMCWYDNFEQHWSEIAANYGERFRRMWRFWLLSSAAAFRARRTQLWQIVLSPSGVPGGYREVR